MDTDSDVMRSSDSEYPNTYRSAQGVGARQGNMLPLKRGGGYLDNCTHTEVSEGLQISELSAMGIGGIWIDVAKMVGVENFVQMWRHLDSSDRGVEHNGQIRISVPKFSTFMKYQRNQFIRTLDAEGKSSRAIQEALEKEHSINIHLRTIERVIGNGC